MTKYQLLDMLATLIYYHCVHVHQFVEEHELHCDESVVLGPHVLHVVVELTGNSTQLLEYVAFGSESTRITGITAVPGELVKPWRGERGCEVGRRGEFISKT